MRPLRFLLTLLSCVLAFFFFLLFMGPWREAAQEEAEGQSSAVRAYFNWRTPSSLFPPSAIIRLTDDNSTFFLARPAAFGPLLPVKSLSGQIWVGSGFGDDNLGRGSSGASAEGELGCSDVPGWNDGSYRSGLSGNKRLVADMKNMVSSYGPGLGRIGATKRSAYPVSSEEPAGDTIDHPHEDDGTDDYLHHPLPASDGLKTNGESRSRKAAHADIQSIQESAEIAGKIVLLSRGGCGFLEKVKWVQRRGGIALIVGDDIRGGPLVTMYARGDTSNVTIPSLFTSHTTAHLLSSLIPLRGGGGDLDDVSRIGVGLGDKVKHQLGKGRKAGNADRSSIAGSKTTSKKLTGHQDDIQDAMSDEEDASTTRLWFRFLLGDRADWADTRRPPSSGNIDWPSVNTGGDGSWFPIKQDARSASNKAKSQDGFTIGVQDWRDPDLFAKQDSPASDSSSQLESTIKLKSSKELKSPFKGGSMTPSSGGYLQDGYPSIAGASRPNRPTDDDEARRSGWVARFLFARGLVDSEFARSTPKPEETSDVNTEYESHMRIQDFATHYVVTELPEPREGLWVTLTPTSMSSSPFFDTLLVLVVSPLVTLTVVYALLLLRSRIRRRRWRAPKSIVERLPVRTYQTMPSSTTTTASSVLSSPVTVTTPLLPASSPAGLGSPRSTRTEIPNDPLRTASAPQTRVLATSADQIEEKRASGLAEWRRKYGGRQRECVVCLEEYVDGVSRVMSLPCGHEFHAECITPWLTTRRRTCPICKGDVVRSLARSSGSTAAGALSDLPSSSLSASDPPETSQNTHAPLSTEAPAPAYPLFHSHQQSPTFPSSSSLQTLTTTAPFQSSLSPHSSPLTLAINSNPPSPVALASSPSLLPHAPNRLPPIPPRSRSFDDLERGMYLDE